MSRITLTVCDICQDVSKEVRSYRISSEGEAVNVDLCAEHSVVLHVFFTKGERQAASIPSAPSSNAQPGEVKPRPKRLRSMQVVSMEQIERLK